MSSTGGPHADARAVERIRCQLWCVGCVCDNAERLHRLVYHGRATARGGVLHTEASCTVCGSWLNVGQYVEAVTFHAYGQNYPPWEAHYIRPGAEKTGG